MNLKHKMITLRKLLVASAVACLFATSCTTPKDITYMQGFETGDMQTVKEDSRLTFQPDDRLSICVSSKDMELANVFQLVVSQRQIGQTGSSSSNTMTASYVVSPTGEINFPQLGRLRIEGLTRNQVASMIEGEIIGKGLLKDAIVSVEFMNASIAVLGDVSSPGEYAIDRDNLTILQALSKAGDLNITGDRKNVLVVREESGKEVAYRVDLTNTAELMQSPAYYLRQNDVVYVEPNDYKKRTATNNANTVLTPSFWLSVASFLTTISVLIFK